MDTYNLAHGPSEQESVCVPLVYFVCYPRADAHLVAGGVPTGLPRCSPLMVCAVFLFNKSGHCNGEKRRKEKEISWSGRLSWYT